MSSSKQKPEYVLFDENTQAIIYNYQTNAIQRMLDFDFIAKRKTPSVAAIVAPGQAGLHKAFFGTKEILVPIYNTLAEATSKHENADVMVNFASFRSSYETSKEALLSKTIRTVAIIAEGIPEKRSRELAKIAKDKNKWIIGPATVGGITAGCFKIGNTAGTIENITESKLYRKGHVGLVAKSGGMSNEIYNIINRNSDGVYEGIAIGGDRYPGSSLVDHLERMDKNPDIAMLACLGEVGGEEEYRIIDSMKAKRISKPLVIWVTGTCAKVFTSEVQFGHAGARADNSCETAEAKNQALKQAGAIVPNSFDDYGKAVKETFDRLVRNGVVTPAPEYEVPKVPIDYANALKSGHIRRSANFICSISDDRGDEVTYNKIPLSKVLEKNVGIGGVIGLLWFKKELPDYASKFIDLSLVVTADHGPCVAAAHNTAVTTRAGKDLISSLVSGLLTIGPRFGGALDGAAYWFSYAVDEGMSASEFVRYMKNKGENIPGIGHRIKSVQNPDVRVSIIKEYAKKHFKDNRVLDFALEVEKLTTSKRNTLILNVDGCIAVCFVDMLRSCGAFTKEEANRYIEMGALNAVFVLSRSIGLVGHHLDQKRLEQPLYRHPWDDVSFL
ncbi:MAG: ATP citrate synthase [Oligoflexia bacterium]|nr:ATP citrate synthase [Oligoflexia bacterium]MBF0367105.1 ATP citrate synthase [Oligoflexia bacterium]